MRINEPGERRARSALTPDAFSVHRARVSFGPCKRLIFTASEYYSKHCQVELGIGICFDAFCRLFQRTPRACFLLWALK